MSDIADEVTEGYAAAMEEAISSATKAEAERDEALARVAELEAQYEPPRPVGNTPIRIVPGRAYLVKVYTEYGNLVWSPRVAGHVTGNSYDHEDGALTHYNCYDGTWDLIEFEMWGVETRENVELEARRYLTGLDFEDDEPGAPYPTTVQRE